MVATSSEGLGSNESSGFGATGGKRCPACETLMCTLVDDVKRCALVRCLQCGMVSAAHSFLDSELAEVYSYERRGIADAINSKRYHEWLRTFESYRLNGTLLDIGCGSGQFLSAARSFGWRLCGTEIAESARDVLDANGFEVFYGKLKEAGFHEEHFDVITMLELIEHLADPLEYLEEAFRILRRGGLLFVTTPNFNSLSRFLIGDSWRVIDVPEHLHYFSVGSLKRILARTGFRIISLKTTGFDPYEVLRVWRGGTSRGTDARERVQALRAWCETHPHRRLAKRTLNAALSALRVGDTVRVLAIREEPEVRSRDLRSI